MRVSPRATWSVHQKADCISHRTYPLPVFAGPLPPRLPRPSSEMPNRPHKAGSVHGHRQKGTATFHSLAPGLDHNARFTHHRRAGCLGWPRWPCASCSPSDGNSFPALRALVTSGPRSMRAAAPCGRCPAGRTVGPQAEEGGELRTHRGTEAREAQGRKGPLGHQGSEPPLLRVLLSAEGRPPGRVARRVPSAGLRPVRELPHPRGSLCQKR